MQLFRKRRNRKTIYYNISTIQTIKHNIGKLITRMLWTEELMNTQFYDKVEEHRTLYYTKTVQTR